MAFSYLIPTILYLPPGTSCVAPVPWGQVGSQLIDGRGRVVWYVKVFCEGQTVDSFERIVEFADSAVIHDLPEPYRWNDNEQVTNGQPGFMECGIRAANQEAIFTEKRPLAFYSIYSASDNKSYFSDNAWKYAVPQVIAQIREYGQFVDGYPTVRIDRDHDVGMSLILINPYLRAVMARVVTPDDRSIERIKVPPQSARSIPLEQLLSPDERVWVSQIQLTANNRLITYISWHSLEDPRIVSDQEHLESYRGEVTHIPASQYLRLAIGNTFLRSLR
ncbi:MAG: hypothetical protein QNJ92_00540 [Alphaproteobacteria bacterium]|nr:hypothetical protein [Alphaproteobacteria bacterium]